MDPRSGPLNKELGGYVPAASITTSASAQCVLVAKWWRDLEVSFHHREGWAESLSPPREEWAESLFPPLSPNPGRDYSIRSMQRRIRRFALCSKKPLP
eukprot:4375679-Amphidinium_carterae.1